MNDFSRNFLVNGGIEVSDLTHAAERELASLLELVLGERRYIAAVQHRRAPGADAESLPAASAAADALPESEEEWNEYRELVFSLVCDDEQRVLGVDDAGAIVACEPLSRVEELLSGELGTEVSLWPDTDLFDEEDDEDEGEDEDDCPVYSGAAEHEEEDAAEALDRLNDEQLSEVFGAAFGDVDALSDDESDDEEVVAVCGGHTVWGAQTCECGLPDDRVLVFSRRGPASATGLTMLSKNRVAVGTAGDWSVFRYVEEDFAELPAATKRELPSIEARIVAEGSHLIDVETAAARQGESRIVYPDEATGRRAILDPAKLGDAARRLLAETVNPHLRADSTVSAILTDPGLAVDRDALLAAFDADAELAPLERVEAALIALGLPDDLVVPALRGDDLPEQQTFEPGFARSLLQLAEGGLEGTRPRGSAPTFIGRIDDRLRRSPALATAVSLGEAAAGIAAIVAGSTRATRRRGSRRGPWRVLGILGGILLVVDAVLDLLLTARRTSRAADERIR